MTFRLVHWKNLENLDFRENTENYEIPFCAICSQSPCFQVVSSLYCSACSNKDCWKRLVELTFLEKFVPAPRCNECRGECDEICEISDSGNFSHREENALKIRLYSALCAKCQDLRIEASELN
jgi:hypothetical protein